MKLQAVPTLLRCALLSSVVMASADLHRHRPRARYSCSEPSDFPAVTIAHSRPIGDKNSGLGAYGDAEDVADLGEYAAVNELDSAADGYPGDGGGYPSGHNDEALSQDDFDFDVPDGYDLEADRHGSSHKGHYSLDSHLASLGSGSSSDTTIFQEYGLGHDPYDIYGQDTSSPTLSTSSLSASDLSSNLPDGGPETTTADTPTGQTDTIIGLSTTTFPSTTIIEPSITSTGPLPSATQTLCPDNNLKCVDGFLIGCAAVPHLVDVGSRVPKRVGSVINPQICHQSCVEDPLCTAWEDTEEPLFFDGGCYHYTQAFVLNSTEPFLSSLGINSFGIRGICDLAIPDATLTTAATTPAATPLTSSQSSTITDTATASLTSPSQSFTSTAIVTTALSSSSQPSTSTAVATSPSASGDIVTIPTSETSLCPQLDGQCLNSNLIRCDRDLDLDADPEYSDYTCVSPVPAITSERECHEACLPNFTCIGWKMTQVLTGAGAPACCHVMGSLELRDPLPQQLPLATFPEYESYGLRFRCDGGRESEELCPSAENSCLDDFLIKCDRFLFDDLTPATADFAFDWHDEIFSQLGCHQACAEDATCTAWGGYSEPLDSGEGGGELFDCYHVHAPVVLQSPLPDFVREPDPGSAARYGVRGACT
ncbi:hypothetical protein BJ166DRAFT_307634 [Pestalotiopsis sp. NC0098]|nr:hypothetical protein BJ166DRAFT_307634 [Pestalotiopsis sp. NC0098]